ncbi:MAG: hypothetical protein KAU35_01470 [candidate division Zixibacteria bacterium]|nr:hypothetical protein [candidate division Zixibacteria bacterium]
MAAVNTRTLVKVAITAVALAIGVLHLIKPDLGVDSVIIVLLVCAIVPWLFPMLRSVELPGGLKFEFRDLRRIEEEGRNAGLISTPEQARADYPFLEVVDADPILALAGLRIEIEKRLRFMAESNGMNVQRKGLGAILHYLHDNHLVTGTERSVIGDLTVALNRAAHGLDVDVRTRNWVIDVGPQILTGLDGKTKYSVQARSERFPHDMAAWGAEKSERVVMLVACIVDIVRDLYPENGDTRETMNYHLYPLIWDATKLYAFFCDTEWETRDRDLVAHEGIKGFEKLKQRYARPSL